MWKVTRAQDSIRVATFTADCVCTFRERISALTPPPPQPPRVKPPVTRKEALPFATVKIKRRLGKLPSVC
ncbi:Hypothetical protein SMAX5B_018310 [Scophthalmus maximus]|uniref:Uncharacterized protein n=1 Tax=Scophthalmus maximus TaxID=52904 RepID=A0A2U9C9Q1_SCOMX|nr:Hypothetical protein SMAX5B_018310 [Scophthalmus maximus]